MASILSTKTLTNSQRELLLNTGIGLVEYNAINISFSDVTLPKKIKNGIFTSQNAVAAINDKSIEIKQVFCVGQKTKVALENLGYNVVLHAENALELGRKIIAQFPETTFTFFCGNKRRDELPELLRKQNISFTEIEVYKTTLNKKVFQRTFNAIMCFSPSGVQSYFGVNNAETETVVCIGNTTAAAAKQYTDQIVIANTTSVESVIAKTVRILKTTL
jgi:uroporphyrinogen-III synthase